MNYLTCVYFLLVSHSFFRIADSVEFSYFLCCLNYDVTTENLETFVREFFSAPHQNNRKKVKINRVSRSPRSFKAIPRLLDEF